MRQAQFTTRFHRDLKREKKRGRDRARLEAILTHILEHGDAPKRCRPHNLVGDWAGYRECHIAPDWLLIYSVNDSSAVFFRTGSHSDLFD